MYNDVTCNETRGVHNVTEEGYKKYFKLKKGSLGALKNWPFLALKAR